MSGERIATAILISGRGSNMAALIAAAAAPDYPASIRLVASNRPDAAGLGRAAATGIPTAVLDHKSYSDRAEFDGALDRLLRTHGIELVCLAGFMRILTEAFVKAWSGRLLNIHPSLLPAYRGLDTHARALADGATRHGCTVHQVVTELDAGPIVAQSEVAVRAGDDPSALASRVLQAENRLYPRALADVAADLLRRRR